MSTKPVQARLANKQGVLLAPRQTNPDSFLSQLAALDAGDCLTRAVRIPLPGPKGDLNDVMIAMRGAMKNTLTKTISRIEAETGHEYSYEFGDLLMPSRKLYLVAVITRTK